MNTQKKTQLPFAQDVKKMSKQFKCLNKSEIRILLQFCQYDVINTQKILCIISQVSKPELIIKQLLDKPEKSEVLLNHYLQIYKKKYPQKQQQLQKQQIKIIQSQKSQYPLFDLIPLDLILEISLFLNPIQMIKFMNLRKQFRNHYLSSTLILQNHFKKICRTLFSNPIPVLPNPTRFLQLKQYILNNPLEFSPNIRNAANTNIQTFVWQRKPTDCLVNKQYYLNFGSFEDIYKKAPRIHFNGYYVLKQKYTKMGQKTFDRTNTPFHVVHYYRYIRFFPDGSIVYQISNRKMKQKQIQEYLSKKNLDNASESMKGEFMQHKRNVYIKYFRCNSVFNYELQIKNDSLLGGLVVNRLYLQLMDSSFIVQQLYKWNKFSQQKIFMYRYLQSFCQQNQMKIQCHSL